MKQKTFLVSSSIQELVPRQKTKIIFLGKWCFTSINMNRIKNCDYKTLKYHWKNKKKLEKIITSLKNFTK